VEDPQEALDVIFGMILINDNNAIVLFDSTTSHSFVASTIVQKHNPSSKEGGGGRILSQSHNP
jgi:phosphoglucomutase